MNDLHVTELFQLVMEYCLGSASDLLEGKCIYKCLLCTCAFNTHHYSDFIVNIRLSGEAAVSN